MSKVHEALKRAHEERKSSVTGQIGESANGPLRAELQTPVCVAARVSEEPESGMNIDPTERVLSRDISGVAEVSPVHENPRALRIETPIPSAVHAVKPPVSSVAERRLHTPVAGRDPRTGQFLRFEDLLNSCARPSWVLNPSTVVFSDVDGGRTGAEQFRTLRSRLYQLREVTPLKRILVTSALAGEGKTFVATNLAQAIAREKGRKVLLIDGDLRCPALHKPLGASMTPGLSDYLRGEAADPEIIQHGQDGNLCLIPAGNPGSDPSELLSNGALEKLLERLTPLFDWVIIDSPPCLPVADANVLAGHCDGVLLVLRARSTPSSAAEKARKELQKRRLIGVVMNAVEEAQTYGGYYGYGNGAKALPVKNAVPR